MNPMPISSIRCCQNTKTLKPNDVVLSCPYPFPLSHDPEVNRNQNSLEENGQIGLMIRDLVIEGNGERAIEVFKRTRLSDNVDDLHKPSMQLMRLYQIIGLIYAIYYKMLERADSSTTIDSLRDQYLWKCHPHQDLSVLDEIAIEMIREFSLEANRHNPYESYTLLIQKSIEFIDSHLNEKLSLKDVSNALHVNACYLSSIFKKETGQSMTLFISERKVALAKTLLTTTQLPVSSICSELGYDNPSYFTEVFKKITGITPKEYKTSHL